MSFLLGFVIGAWVGFSVGALVTAILFFSMEPFDDLLQS